MYKCKNCNGINVDCKSIVETEEFSIKEEKIIKYDSLDDYYTNLQFWSNSLGELHYHGERDIKEEELPKELKRAYNELWNDGLGSLCYLTEYKKRYYVALINEFYQSGFCEEVDLEDYLDIKAKGFMAKEELADCTIVIANSNIGCKDFVVLLPWDMQEEKFVKIADITYKEFCKES